MFGLSQRTVVKAAIATGLSVAVSVAIVLLLVPFLGGHPDGPGFWMSVLCPLLIAAPASAYQFHQKEQISMARDQILRMHGELHQAHRELTSLHAALQEKASTDSLTGGLNRETVFARLAEACCRPPRPCALLIGDADHFKNINDTFGHQTGDRALRAIAAAIAASIRPQDFWGRIGGEEFIIFLDGADSDTALSIADGIRRAVLDIALMVADRRVPVSMSFGIACADDVFSPETLFGIADRRLYEAKNAGRNRVVIGRVDAA